MLNCCNNFQTYYGNVFSGLVWPGLRTRGSLMAKDFLIVADIAAVVVVLVVVGSYWPHPKCELAAMLSRFTFSEYHLITHPTHPMWQQRMDGVAKCTHINKYIHFIC